MDVETEVVRPPTPPPAGGPHEVISLADSGIDPDRMIGAPGSVGLPKRKKQSPTKGKAAKRRGGK